MLPGPGEVLSVQVFCELVGSGATATEFDVKFGASIFQTAGNRPKIQPGTNSSDETIPEATATQLLVDLSAAHESLVTLAEQVIEVLSTAGAISLPPVVARVIPKTGE